jgi:DNA-binding NarL/FixJ family response regulator
MGDERPIRVAVADDQRLLVRGLTDIVDTEPGMEIVGVAHTGEEAVALCLREKPDIVLMDISMPVVDGVSATRRIRKMLPETRVIILTVHGDETHAYWGLRAGADGYLLKDCTPDDLTLAIRNVHAGHAVMASGIVEKALGGALGLNPHTGSAPRLTERELQVIRGLTQGKSNNEIARSMDISPKTVRSHVSNIFKKLNVFDRTQVVVYAFREGLVDIEDTQHD